MTPKSATTPRNPKYRDEAWLEQTIEASGPGFTRKLAEELRAAVRELAAMTASVAESERDAGRYRWLREAGDSNDQVIVTHPLSLGILYYRAEKLDAAIDAARAEGEK